MFSFRWVVERVSDTASYDGQEQAWKPLMCLNDDAHIDWKSQKLDFIPQNTGFCSNAGFKFRLNFCLSWFISRYNNVNTKGV
jgi:hypothetical protein